MCDAVSNQKKIKYKPTVNYYACLGFAYTFMHEVKSINAHIC